MAFKDSKPAFRRDRRTPRWGTQRAAIMVRHGLRAHLVRRDPRTRRRSTGWRSEGKLHQLPTTAVCAASRLASLTGRNSRRVAIGESTEISTGFLPTTAGGPAKRGTCEFSSVNDRQAWIGKTHLGPIHKITVAGPSTGGRASQHSMAPSDSAETVGTRLCRETPESTPRRFAVSTVKIPEQRIGPIANRPRSRGPSPAAVTVDEVLDRDDRHRSRAVTSVHTRVTRTS